jgi:hypothetical protein
MPPAVASIFSVLLIATGVAKLHRPDETARALRQVGLPLARPLTLFLGGCEVLVGGAALVSGKPVALMIQAAMYALFLAWVVAALKLDVPLSSCGCIGRDDTPPYWGHVALNSAGIVGSLTVALLAPSLSLEGGALLANLGLVVVGAGIAWALLNQGARAHGLVSR